MPNALPPNTGAAVPRRNTRSYRMERERKQLCWIVAVQYEAGASIFLEPDMRSRSADDFLASAKHPPVSMEQCELRMRDDSNYEAKN